MRAAIAVILVLIATLVLLAATVPTFDFDEALYRRVAEEMKQSEDYFVTTWDGKPFYEKPPTYMWSIVLASRIVDGPGPHVSVLASRLPSLACSFLTLILLAWFWWRAAPDYAREFGVTVDASHRWLLSPLLPVLAYGAGTFATGGASSVVLDPMLTLCLLAPLMIFTRAFLRSDASGLRLTGGEMMTAGTAMACAVAVKGLIGFVLPAFALVVHALIARSSTRWSRLTIRQIAATFAIAIAGASAFFLLLYQFTGAPFVYEFFARQHFLRATKPIQGHSGSLFFHIAVVLFLGGPLVAFVFRAMTRKHDLSFGRWGFPLTWAAAVIIFFSAVATKLPNYTWPVWPALVIALCVLLLRGYASTAVVAARMRRSLNAVAFLSLAPVALVFIALGMGVDLLLGKGGTLRNTAILSALEPLPVSVRIGLIVAGVIFALQLFDVRRFGRHLETRSRLLWRSLASAAVLNCLALAVLCLFVLPFADRMLRGPLIRLSRDASAEHVVGGDLITIGLFSPTVSSNYDVGPVRQVGRFAHSDLSRTGQHLLLVPAWQVNACNQPGFVVIRNDEYLTLCEKRGERRQ